MLFEEGKGVFIYLDPVYSNVSKLYGVDGQEHDSFDYYKLKDNLERTPHKFLMTLDDSNFIRDLFSGFNMRSYKNAHTIANVKGTNEENDKGRELLVSNFIKFDTGS